MPITSPEHPFEAQVVRFTKGPSMITYGAIMIFGLAVLMGVMMAMWPTPPPEANMAGPGAEARAMAEQSRAATIMAVMCAIPVLLLFRLRTVTFDFAAKTLRVQDSRAFMIRTERTIPFADIEAMRVHTRLIGTYLGWVMRIHRRGGSSILLGPWAPDPGLPILIRRVGKSGLPQHG